MLAGWQFVDDGEIVPLDAVLYPIFKKLGLKLRNRIVWHFGHGLHSSKRLSGRYETINWWTKGDDYTWNLDPIRIPSKYPNKRHFKGPNIGKLSGNPKGKNPSDVWEFPNVKHNHPEKTIHPCQFPVELVERLVLSMTDPEDKVFDPYMGVGSAVIAAIKHDRIGYGCDNVPEYVEIARQRIVQWQQGALPLRPMGKPIYDPRKTQRGPLMRIKAVYSHLNGQEFLLVHRKELWDEIQEVINEIDAEACKTKRSRERTMAGRLLYSPTDMNNAFKSGLQARGWTERRNTFWVASDERLLRGIYSLPGERQRELIEEAGQEPIMSYNQTDYLKERVAIEVQFGKYASWLTICL